MGDSGATDPPGKGAELSIVVEFSYVLALTLVLYPGWNFNQDIRHEMPTEFRILGQTLPLPPYAHR